MMRRSRAELIYAGMLLLTALAAHAFTSAPFIFLFPNVIAYTVRQPFWYLALAGAGAELFSAHLPGIVLAVVMLPLAVRRTLMLSTDVSLSFFILIAGTLTLQFIVLFAPDAWLAAIGSDGVLDGWRAAIRVVPWTKLTHVVAYAVPLFIISVLVYFNRTW